MPWKVRHSRTRETSVRPAKWSVLVASGKAKISANVCSNAFMPAPPVRMSVPSISKRTSLTTVQLCAGDKKGDPGGSPAEGETELLQHSVMELGPIVNVVQING